MQARSSPFSLLPRDDKVFVFLYADLEERIENGSHNLKQQQPTIKWDRCINKTH